jgi:hypothetical protein
MESHSNPTLKAMHRYYWHFGVSMSAYVIAIFFSRWLWHSANGPWRTVLAVLPIIPVICVFASVVRFLLATDELQRRIVVNSLALAGGATALLAVTYGLLEADGLPRLSAWWTYAVFMSSWIVAGYFVCRRYQ